MNLVMHNKYLHIIHFTDKCHKVTVLKYLLSTISYIGIDIKKDELIHLAFREKELDVHIVSNNRHRIEVR